MSTVTLRRYPDAGHVFAPGEFAGLVDTVVELDVGGAPLTGVLLAAQVDADGWGVTFTLEVGTSSPHPSRLPRPAGTI